MRRKTKDMHSGIAEELRNLQFLSGSDFVVQLKRIVARNEFYPYESGSKIFITGGEGREDFSNLSFERAFTNSMT